MARLCFEELIRESLDIGRPNQVSLLFDRKVTRRTPGRFRTRVITEGVVPSLQVPDQTISQGVSSPSHRNDDQRYPRFGHWPTHRKS